MDIKKQINDLQTECDFYQKEANQTLEYVLAKLQKDMNKTIESARQQMATKSHSTDTIIKMFTRNIISETNRAIADLDNAQGFAKGVERTQAKIELLHEIR